MLISVVVIGFLVWFCLFLVGHCLTIVGLCLSLVGFLLELLGFLLELLVFLLVTWLRHRADLWPKPPVKKTQQTPTQLITD